uniref:Uncharacterized protein n=1 Tax=Picea sitchensis TaxID=3332 RepID=D5AC23_PICSI|nr:unknown [Picea sitchensis]
MDCSAVQGRQSGSVGFPLSFGGSFLHGNGGDVRRRYSQSRKVASFSHGMWTRPEQDDASLIHTSTYPEPSLPMMFFINIC